MENLTFLDYLAARDENLYLECLLNESFDFLHTSEKDEKKPSWAIKLFPPIFHDYSSKESVRRRIVAFLMDLVDLLGYQSDQYYKRVEKNPIIKVMKHEMDERKIQFENDLARQKSLQYFKDTYNMSKEDLKSYMQDSRNSVALKIIWDRKRYASSDDEVANLIKDTIG